MARIVRHKPCCQLDCGVKGESWTTTDRLRVGQPSKSKEAFIALISDDLLTPLAAIRAAAELIGKLQHGPATLVVQQCVVSILDSSTRLTAMVEDLLDISRLEDGSFPVAARPISL